MESRIEMTQVGTGKYRYELIQDYARLPAGESFGLVSRVAVDSQDRVYVFQRKNPPVVVFDRDGKYLNSWGIGAVKDPHGLRIVNDLAYITDREDSVAVIYTLDGKPLQVIGRRGVHSDTGCEKPGALVPRAAGPFNYPTEMAPGSLRRSLRYGRLPQLPGAPVYARGTAHQVVGRAGQDRARRVSPASRSCDHSR